MNEDNVRLYRRALQNCLSSFSDRQLAMLHSLLVAPSNQLSVTQLASVAGYRTFHPVNTQLGRVARAIANASGIAADLYDPRNLKPIITSTIAYGVDESYQSDSWIWRLKPEFVEALEWVGLEPLDLPAPLPSIVDDLAEFDTTESDLTQTERWDLRAARIGQGRFRDDLLSLWNGCSVTGVSNPDLLRASHLKPWRDCTNSERLDRDNGLLLIPALDHLVDSHLCTFDTDGRIILSEVLTSKELAALGVTRDMKLRRTVWSTLERYLSYHRDKLFRG